MREEKVWSGWSIVNERKIGKREGLRCVGQQVM